METLAIFDRENYEKSLPRTIRHSSRAIIFRNNKIALIYEEKYNMYVFPGGSIDPNETMIEAVIRETKEETGLIIIPNTIQEFGKVIEIRKDIYINGIYEQHDFYYTCDIEDKIMEQKLSATEKEIGYKLKFVTIEEAILLNEIEIQSGKKFSERETFILKYIKGNGIKNNDNIEK